MTKAKDKPPAADGLDQPLAGAAEQAGAELQAALDARAQAEAALEEQRAELTELREARAGLENEVREARQSVENVKAEMAQRDVDLEALEAQLAGAGESEVTRLRQRVAELSEEVGRLSGPRPRGPIKLVLRNAAKLRGATQKVGFVLLAGNPARALTAGEIDKAVCRGDVVIEG